MDWPPRDRYGQLSAETLNEYREALSRMENVRGLIVYGDNFAEWFLEKAETAEEEGHNSVAHALRQAAYIAEERSNLRELIRDIDDNQGYTTDLEKSLREIWAEATHGPTANLTFIKQKSEEALDEVNG